MPQSKIELIAISILFAGFATYFIVKDFIEKLNYLLPKQKEMDTKKKPESEIFEDLRNSLSVALGTIRKNSIAIENAYNEITANQTLKADILAAIQKYKDTTGADCVDISTCTTYSLHSGKKTPTITDLTITTTE